LTWLRKQQQENEGRHNAPTQSLDGFCDPGWSTAKSNFPGVRPDLTLGISVLQFAHNKDRGHKGKEVADKHESGEALREMNAIDEERRKENGSCKGEAGKDKKCGQKQFAHGAYVRSAVAGPQFDHEHCITLKLQGLPRMSVPACVSKARANQLSNPKVYLKSLVERDLQGHWRELCTR